MKRLRIIDGQPPVEVEILPGEEDTFAPEPPAPRLVEPLEFLERFTQEERIAIRQAARQSDALEDWLDMLRAAKVVDLDERRTVAGLTALVLAGLLTAARRDEILA